MCASTHIPERVYVDTCLSWCVCACMPACVMSGCVCNMNCWAPEQSLNPFSCLSVVSVSGQEELVSPPCTTVFLPRLHDLVWSISWVEWGGKGGEEPWASWHGGDWLRRCRLMLHSCRISSLSPSLLLWPLSTKLIHCGWKCWSVIAFSPKF